MARNGRSAPLKLTSRFRTSVFGARSTRSRKWILGGSVTGLAILLGIVVAAGGAGPTGGLAGDLAGSGPTPSQVAADSGATPSAEPDDTPSSGPTPTPGSPNGGADDPSGIAVPGEAASGSPTTPTALAMLGTLAVKGKAPKTGYDRTGMFGSAWLDVDHNDCDTRNDILARDLTAIVKAGACRVITGQLVSPYTTATINFVRGNDTSALVQIDHMVALSNAWQTGAQQLSQAQRESLANDPLNLLAVDGRSNSQKGDGDTATWLPANKGFRCAYVARQVSVKAAYQLWVTAAEHDAMAGILSTCPSEPALTSTAAAKNLPAKSATPASLPATGAGAPALPMPAPAPPAVVPVPVPVRAPAPAPAAPAFAPAPAAPAPAQVPAPAPAPAPAAHAPGTVHPGSYCAASGATGVTTKGTAMACKTSPTDTRLRWRAA